MDIVNFGWMLFLTMLALTLVCGLAYLIFRIVLPKLNVNLSSNSMIRVVDRIGLDTRKSLYIIEVADQFVLIAVSENGVQLVSKLEGDSVRAAEEKFIKEQTTQGSNINIAERFSQIMKKNPEDKK